MTKRIAVTGFIVFQLALFIAIGYFAVQAWVWKTEALNAIVQNAGHDARDDYRRGKRRLLEVKIIDDNFHDYSGRSYNLYEKIPANRRDEPFEVWFVVIPSTYFSSQAGAYVKGYNQPMRIRHEKPELFTPEGERRPLERKNSRPDPTAKGGDV